MCLDTVQEDLSKVKLPEYGWKVMEIFEYEKDLFFPPCYGVYNSPMKKNIWYHDDVQRFHPPQIQADTHAFYPYGFHVFRTKKDAKEWKKDLALDRLTIKKVKIKRLRAKGTQIIGMIENHTANVFVVGSILIIK